MRLTSDQSTDFDPAKVVDPKHRGEVAWSQFNESFEKLQRTDWRAVNRGRSYPLPKQLLRLATAFVVQQRDAILDLQGKAEALAHLPVPRDPDIVFFGAEAGWEALLIQALFGAGGKVLLIDCDRTAHQRYLRAPDEVRVPAPVGSLQPELILRRDRTRIEYLQEDFFEVERPRQFDVGVDWGLLEHFDDDGKLAAMHRTQSFIRDGGLQISSVPRDCLAVRIFYQAFRDELNFGYRELMRPDEFLAQLKRGGFSVESSRVMPSYLVAASRVRHA